MSIAAPATSGPMSRPIPFVVVARPEIAPRCCCGMSLKSSPHASVMTIPPAIATGKITGRYQSCHSVREAARHVAAAVDERGDDDHRREADAVAEPPRDQRRDEVPAADDRRA